MVSPFEIEGIAKCLAHYWIGELGSPRVEPEALHARRLLMINQPLDNDAVGDLRNVVGGSPFLGVIFEAKIVFTSLECLDRHFGVAVIIVADRIYIITTDVYRQIARPIIVDADQRDRTAGLQFGDAVGAATERRLEGRRLEIAGLP